MRTMSESGASRMAQQESAESKGLSQESLGNKGRMSYKDGKCICFDDKELNLLKQRIEKNPTMEQKLYPDEALALLARLEAAEVVCKTVSNMFVPIDRAAQVEEEINAWRKSAGK